MATMLLVDPQSSFNAEFRVQVERAGHCLATVANVPDAYSLCTRARYDLVVFAGQYTASETHQETLHKLHTSGASLAIVTERPELAPAGAAGMPQYFLQAEAPCRVISLLEQLDRTRERAEEPPLPVDYQIYGKSPQLLQAFEQLWRYARSSAAVLLTGATGTGKELFAKALHRMSPRSEGPFITIDCASLPETLVESLLFGYDRGAFTGASSNKEGLIKLADGGTLFLDEVGELPLDIQRKFLRVLQERRFRSVGGGRETGSDFRLVAATNRDLDRMVAEGLFREDLCFRLKILQIELPPLAEREDDIVIIAQTLLDKFCDREKLPRKSLAEDLKAVLREYYWPGNIRELVNVVESLFALAWDEPLLRIEHLPPAQHAQIAETSYFAATGAEDEGAFLARRRRRKLRGREQVVLDRTAGDSAYAPEQERRTNGQEQYTLFESALYEAPPVPEEEAAPVPRLTVPPFAGLACFREERRRILEAFEKEYLTSLYVLCSGKIGEACKVSRLSRPRLYELYRKYGILQQSP